MDFWQRQNGGGTFILPLPFFERREAMDVPCKQELEFLPNVAGLPILGMFKTNIKITISYYSFEQYLRPFFVLAHNADILPDSGTGVHPCARRARLCTNQHSD